jgi:peptidoglycan L-alanyl-D-glutamate endopeptidase CwlK
MNIAMSYKFSKRSLKHLETLHPDLQILLYAVIRHYDFSVIQGFRSNEEQDQRKKEGKSTLEGGKSKHNIFPSLAVDIAPYPINWKDISRFYHFIGYVKGTADQLGIKIRCGADWNNNNILNDQTFNDLNHIELLR